MILRCCDKVFHKYKFGVRGAVWCGCKGIPDTRDWTCGMKLFGMGVYNVNQS